LSITVAVYHDAVIHKISADITDPHIRIIIYPLNWHSSCGQCLKHIRTGVSVQIIITDYRSIWRRRKSERIELSVCIPPFLTATHNDRVQQDRFPFLG
jgi:hypothetical protein